MRYSDTMTLSPILEVKNVTKTVDTPQGPLTILHDVSFSVSSGEKVAIIGPSGSGKSTLLSIIGLLDTPTKGEVYLDSVRVDTLMDHDAAKLRNEKIGFIFQSFELIQPFTVYENVSAPLEIGQSDVSKTAITELLSSVGLTERVHALPPTLSGGEKQRVAIARALAHNPEIILADEPTGSLDGATGEKVLSLLLQRTEETGKTLIVITHDERVTKKMNRVLRIESGKLIEA
jgi:putative ABC transport system ATP-binding protein